jgi:itaconate CoA-transferase
LPRPVAAVGSSTPAHASPRSNVLKAFARGYDHAVHGQSSCFVWTNRGKESIVLDLMRADDLALRKRMLARADVFIQTLAPGATERLGISSAALLERHPRYVTCDISGYGERGSPYKMKAYDLLVQTETDLVFVSVSGKATLWPGPAAGNLARQRAFIRSNQR